MYSIFNFRAFVINHETVFRIYEEVCGEKKKFWRNLNLCFLKSVTFSRATWDSPKNRGRAEKPKRERKKKVFTGRQDN